MKQGLWWSFGEPREENGRLVTDFYYQTGKHKKLVLPWPTRHFNGAGDLPIQMESESETFPYTDLTTKTPEAGQRLYDLLGKDAQTSLIRTFANLNEEHSIRVLCLQFPPPTSENRELCLALEDLPWELLHDGEDFIVWRYSLQIIRGHSRDTYQTTPSDIQVNAWGILLVSPFVFAQKEQCESLGLDILEQGREEVKLIRDLEKETNGLIHIEPPSYRNDPSGITTFQELETYLYNRYNHPFQMIHFIGHGVVYDEEPCLCFESEKEEVDYVSVQRLRKLFFSLQDSHPRIEPPSILFLNACGSSSRGRYSSGFASGLHDLGMCVLGFHTEIYDDGKPLLAAKSFYKSLCMEQSLRHPHSPPNVITAIGAARQKLHDETEKDKPAWGSFRAYLPKEITFSVYGRGFLERTIQKIYSQFSHWMNPRDYTDHLSIGLQFAVVFGILMGLANLAYIFPESVLSRHITYQEILSEVTRIFLIGPLSFLAAAIFIAFLTQQNHRFLMLIPGRILWGRWLWHGIKLLPIIVLSSAAFSFLFFYSFSRLDVLTAQTTVFASMTDMPIHAFWNRFNLFLTGILSFSLLLSSWACLRKKETLHSYQSFFFIFWMYGILGGTYIVYLFVGEDSSIYRTAGWVAFLLCNMIAYSVAITKMMKEIAWRASQKSVATTYLSWKKLLPLLGAVLLVILCYYLLEESVRFQEHTIQNAILERKEALEEEEFDPRNEKILERALRERAIREVPDSLKFVVDQDWLLSLVYADYMLYQAFQNGENSLATYLENCLRYLNISKEQNREVEFKDYYCNIFAMAQLHYASLIDDEEEKMNRYEEAREKAAYAVKKDNHNFAYLDTLARVEARIGQDKGDLTMLQKADNHIREAKWRSYFLRSPRAHEVQKSIEYMEKMIHEQINQVKQKSE